MVTIEKRKNVMWLNIGPHRGILRIGIYKEPSKNAITVQLEILKKALGSNKTNEMLTKLSKIPGFQWISERIDLLVIKPSSEDSVKVVAVTESP